jgi:hypothetical protein
MYNSLTVTTAHIQSSFHSLTPLHSVVLLFTPSILILVLRQLPASHLGSLTSTLHGPHGKQGMYCYKACLQSRCLEIDLLLFRASASGRICLATRFLAMGMARTT